MDDNDPADGLTPLVRRWVAMATMAPSVHNTQPWQFQPSGTGIDVYADRTRQLPVIDPAGRELYISVGAAVFTLRVALLASGRVPVHRLLPVPAVPDLAARVRLGQSGARSATAALLAAAIPARHSNRWPFRELSLPTDISAELAAAATAEGAILRVADPVRRRTILGLTRAAEQHWQADRRYRNEPCTWVMPRSAGQGVPGDASGPGSDPNGAPLRDFQLGDPRPAGSFEPRPTIAALYTPDSPSGWLRAGQALQRVLLTATVRGLAATLMTQALELPGLRDLLADRATGYPAQAILRLGYPTRPGVQTPRRPIDEVLLAA